MKKRCYVRRIDLNKYKKSATLEYNRYSRIVSIISNVRLFTFILMIVMFLVGYYNSNIFNYIGFILLFIFIVLVIIHSKYYKLEYYYSNYLRVINNYIARTNDNWYKFSDTGEDLIDGDNIYLRDLDILGNNSLFQYLNVATTEGGRRKLYKRFISINKDSDSVLELANNIDFCIEYQIKLLDFVGKNIDLEDNYKYFGKSIGNRMIDLIIGIVMSGITIILLLLGLFDVISYRYFMGMFIINFLGCYLYQIIFREEFEELTRYVSNSAKLTGIYDIILKEKFISKKLGDMQSKVSLCMVTMDKLNRLEILNNMKDNLVSSFIFNGLLSINIVTMYLYSKVKLDNNYKLGINIIEELEAMISLSVMGVVKDNVCIPERANDIILEFDSLLHPLINENKCISNSFKSLNGINIITGSNMGGKSTFLRTIGINLVLMNAGGFVNASRFRSNYYKIFTSMRVSDDAIKGISTFYGELLRIKEALDYSDKESPMIVLIDEIFKGTNYNDRLYGATEVIKKLNKKNIITFITTHDFELCDTKIDNIWNYHFKEYYEGNNIKFDYIIRKGKCNSTNARYLMKSIGIINN